MNRHQGIALISVLLFMQIWVILGLLALTLTWTTIKSNADFWIKNQLSLQLNTVMKDLENKISHSYPVCTIEPILTAELLKKSLAWWELNSCIGKFNSIHYYYVVEALGLDSCGYFVLSPHPIFASYFRVSLILKEVAPHLLVQSTLALPATTFAQDGCKESLHYVNSGIQMQRILDRD